MAMNGRVALAIVLLGILHFEHTTSAPECLADEKYPGGVRLNIFSARNKIGKWVTKFSAYKDDSNIDGYNDIALDISQDLAMCQGRRTLIIRGQIEDKNPHRSHTRECGTKEIRFHPKCGSNAVVVNDGRTVTKINVGETGFGVTFTNRPLKDNELFEVILDRKTTNFPNSLAIGVSPYSPTDITINKFITDLKPPSWSMYYADLYHNTTVTKKNYARTLDALVEGDRVGMMRRSNGNLHYFINGIDQGAAVIGIPSSVYGLIELYGSAATATIVSKPENDFSLVCET